jgi:dihydroorotate dehydrogenase
MYEKMIGWRNSILAASYRVCMKPIFFRNDPERVHDFVCRAAEVGGHIPFAKMVARMLFGYSSPMLEQEVCGIRFKNPIGLSAGFDKNARLTHILPYGGFGFEEVGSITGKPCAGNQGTRLWRLKHSEGLVVWYGLKNDGAATISRRLQHTSFKFPVGISLAKTNSPEMCDDTAAIADYVKVAKAFSHIGAYYTINISCPNTYGGEPFIDAARLDKLLSSLDWVKHDGPTFIKLAAELDDKQLKDVVMVAKRHKIDGFVCNNLIKDPRHAKLDARDELPGKGGISGRPNTAWTDEQIRRVRKLAGRNMIIIGVGGIFTAEDAYRKIRAGASLVEMITGMIYQGPQTISEINRGLVLLLRRDGFEHISEAVGVDA